MKYFTIVIACLFAFATSASEIVVNSKGQTIQLNDDYTWQFLDISDENGKIVFKIVGAKEFEVSPGSIVKVEKDDFGKIKGYVYYFGVDYTLEITNNLDHPVKINWLQLWSTLEWTVASNFKKNLERNELIDKVLRPGESVAKPIALIMVKSTQTELTEAELGDYKKEYGLDGQLGTISVREYIGVGEESFVFPPEQGVVKAAMGRYMLGSDKGVVPLGREIIFN